MWSQFGRDTIHQGDINLVLEELYVSFFESEISERDVNRMLSRFGMRDNNRYWVLREKYVLSDPDDEEEEWIEYSIVTNGSFGSGKKLRNLIENEIYTDIQEMCEKHDILFVGVSSNSKDPLNRYGYVEFMFGFANHLPNNPAPELMSPVVSYDIYKLERVPRSMKKKNEMIVEAFFDGIFEAEIIPDSKGVVPVTVSRYIAKGHKLDERIESTAINNARSGEIRRDFIIGFSPYLTEDGRIYHKNYWFSRELFEKYVHDHWKYETYINYNIPSNPKSRKVRFVLFINGLPNSVGIADFVWKR